MRIFCDIGCPVDVDDGVELAGISGGTLITDDGWEPDVELVLLFEPVALPGVAPDD